MFNVLSFTMTAINLLQTTWDFKIYIFTKQKKLGKKYCQTKNWRTD